MIFVLIDLFVVWFMIVVYFGVLDELVWLFEEYLELVNVWIVGWCGGWWMLLYFVIDWLGYFLSGLVIVWLLIVVGVDFSVLSVDGLLEMLLHWVVSSDDVDVVIVLIEGGVDIEVCGGLIVGGGLFVNVVGYGCWYVVWLFVECGVCVDVLW